VVKLKDGELMMVATEFERRLTTMNSIDFELIGIFEWIFSSVFFLDGSGIEI